MPRVRNRKKFNKRIIQHELFECRFDPNELGPMQIIFDIDNPSYYENRAIELIRVAQYVEIPYDVSITKAIQMLVVAKLLRKQNEESKLNEENKN